MKPFATAALTILLALTLFNTASAAAPTQFKLIAAADQPVAPLQLDQALGIELIGGDPPQTCSEITLYLDHSPGLSPKCWYGPDKQVFFTLSRSDGNRDQWKSLLGSPFSHQTLRPMAVSLEIGGKSLQGITALDKGTAGNASAGAQDSPRNNPKPTVSLSTYTAPMMTLGLVVSLAVIIITALYAHKGYMIRDSVIPQMLLRHRPYSLGRFQMAFWFVLILSSFLFILAVTKDLNSLNPESFALLGISGATALAAVAIDQSKKEQVDKIEMAVAALGLKTCEDVQLLQNRHHVLSVPPDEETPEQATARLETLEPVSTQWSAYKSAIAPIKSRGLLADLVNDINGPTIHRWQIVVWTFVLGAIYLTKVYTDLETPTFGQSLMALMGISSGVYLGFKIPERQVDTAK